jgi:nucleotide-binding universal stress UspA family protein
VGAYCARHASVPVAVVPREIPTIHDHLDVVVGVDGSVHSLSALRWVLTHLRRSARVTAVRAYAGHGVVGEPLTTAADAAAAAARSELEQEVASVLTDLPGRPPEVQLAVASGDPRAVLRTVGGDADLLVVGARGHGVLDHLLLGSVADALVHHPTVPTILVPDGAARTPGA